MPDVLQIQRPDVGKDNDPEWPTVTYGGNPPRRKTDGGRVALPWQALIVLLAGLVGVVAFGYWRYDAYCGGWANPCWWHGPVLASALVLIPIAAALGRLYTSVQRWRAQALAAQLEAEREGLVKDRYGENEPVWIYQRPNVLAYVAERAAATRALEEAIAPHKKYSGIETLNEGASSKVETNLGAPPALPEPVADDGLVPADTWREWMLDAPHLLISGPTGAGKTTLATALLAEAGSGEALVLDPHDAAGKWPVPAIGGGRDYAGIYAGIDTLMEEMNARFRRLQAGETNFTRLTVLLDEAPAVALHDLKRWQNLVSRLTSEARKVEMRFWLLAQSHLVRDIGLSSLVRRNLGLVALGLQAIDLVRTETDRERQQRLVELVRGQARPAAFAYRSQVEVLDVSRVPTLAQRPILLLPWQPPQAAPAAPQKPLSAVAGQVLAHFGGDRQKAAQALLAARGGQVRGGWRYEVKDVARALGMRDEDVTKIGRPTL